MCADVHKHQNLQRLATICSSFFFFNEMSCILNTRAIAKRMSMEMKAK